MSLYEDIIPIEFENCYPSKSKHLQLLKSMTDNAPSRKVGYLRTRDPGTAGGKELTRRQTVTGNRRTWPQSSRSVVGTRSYSSAAKHFELGK